MKDVKVNAVICQEVYIDPAEAFGKIKNALGFCNDRDRFICVENGELLRGEDVSYHGSPLYEYELISNNPKWIELFNSVQCLDDYFKHSEEPQWNRVIDNNETEDIAEDNAPVMRM